MRSALRSLAFVTLCVLAPAARAQDLAPREVATFEPPVLAPLEPTTVLEIGGAAPLTKEEVLASVRRHHPPLEAAEARVVSAEGVRLASEGAFDLTLGTRASGVFFGYYEYGRLDVSLTQPTPLWGTTFFGGWRIGRGFARGGIPDYYRYDETLDAGELRLGAQIPLWRDGPIDARRAALWRAEHGVVAAAEDRDARLLRVSLAATEAYVRWVAAGRRYTIARDLLRLAEERDGQIAARAAAGAIPPIEHLENRRAVLERRALLVAARRALEQRAIALSLYLRDDQGRPLEVSHVRLPADVELEVVPRRSEPLDLADAVARRPELRRFAAQARAARVSMDLADNQLSPRIDLTVSGAIDLGGPGVTDPDRALEIQRTLERPQMDAMLTVQLPLQLREARGRIDQARAELAALEADTELARDQIHLEVRDARSAVQAAHEAIALASEAEVVARAVADAERVRFDHGATSLLVVNLREAAAAAAAQAHVDARADLAVAHAMLEAALGAPRAR
ncbi:MAG: TolC family protein [Deltaproteobacteria bacterium]|nr:TolC family protein [Deltaproteobacteria bacterium]